MRRWAPLRPATVLAGVLCLWAAVPSGVRADDRATFQHYKKGLELLQKERWDDAITELRAAVQERPRSGTLRFGMFQEKYFPYYHLGRAFLGKGDRASAVAYFNREEAEEAIQRLDRDLFERLVSERKKAGGTGPGPSPTPGAQPTPRPIPSPAPGPIGGPAADTAREDAGKAREKVREFESRHGAAMSPEGRQKLDSLDEALAAALQAGDPARLIEARRETERALAGLLGSLAQALLQQDRAFVSQDTERELRELGVRLRYALAGDDREYLAQRASELDDRVAQARGRVEQAFSAVRAAFASSAEGDNEKAIQALEAALAAQPDDPALRLILARFYFDHALGAGEDSEPRLARAREQAVQAFRLRPNLSFPERYFAPGFLDMIKKARRGL